MQSATRQPATEWLTGDTDACVTLAGTFTEEELAEVATGGLAACCATIGNTWKEVLDVVNVGMQPSQWHRAHEAFDRVRMLTLEMERNQAAPSEANPGPELLLLFVAENAARAVYNATRPVDPFDADSGACFLRALSRFALSIPPDKRALLIEALPATLRRVKEPVSQVKT